MKHKNIIKIAGLLLIAVLASLPTLSETLYVRSYKIKLMASPLHRSKILVVLKRGDQVEKLNARKSWVNIRYKNNTGWVNRLALSNKPPQKQVSLFAKKVDISSKARKRASTFTSAAAARGLMDSGEDKLVIKDGPDFEALAIMEGVEVNVEEAIEYINEDE